MNLSKTAVSVRPSLHSVENEDGVSLAIALPGVRKEDLKFSLYGDVLSLEAPRSDSSTIYTLSTRLARRFAGDRIEAKLSDGVLNVRFPLSEDAKPRTISVD